MKQRFIGRGISLEGTFPNLAFSATALCTFLDISETRSIIISFGKTGKLSCEIVPRWLSHLASLRYLLGGSDKPIRQWLSSKYRKVTRILLLKKRSP